MDLDRLKKKYAEVILKTGVNLQEGQPLLVRTEPAQREFVLLLARVAYDAGALAVSVNYSDPLLNRLRLDRSRLDEYLEFVPRHVPDKYASYLREGWASVSLRGPEYPDIMEGADPERTGIAGKARSQAMKGFLKGISSNMIAWNVCLHPTAEWAEKVLGDADDWERRIWDILVPILRLDSDDPAGAWLDHDAEMKRRAAHMNTAGYDSIRFRGPGTDLSVGMRPDRIFVGGRCVNNSGVEFFPNIPTEEIFSTPDRDRTSGTVRTTRPVEVLGTQVKGAWFRFENGRVADFGSDTNKEILKRYLEFDEGAAAVGEVALVDAGSPIFRSGKVFHNILFDENAASHIALGNGYTDCIRGGTGMSDEELERTGCNLSLVHTDFMIGSEQVSVFGVRGDGSEDRIIDNGFFVI